MTSVAVAPKLYLDGTHRTVEPATTLERLRPLLPMIGVTRVAVITGLDVIGLPVVMVCRPNGRSLSVSQGKGADLPAAKASGIMEAAEAWHAEHVLLPLRLATYRELRTVANVVDVELLLRRSRSRFHPDLPIQWIEGTDVLTAKRVWVPYECVHLDFRSSSPEGSGCFAMTSTGLAAGNHQLEAVSHALCEVVERDALALWDERGAGDRASRRLDLDTVDDPVCRRLLDDYERAGVGVAVWDLTTDVGLPVFSATIVDRHPSLPRRLPAAIGAGCHPDRAVALSRTLAEAAQSRLTVIAGSRDDCPPAYYDRISDPDAIARHLAPLDEQGKRSFADVAHLPAESIDEDVAHELDALKAVGASQVILVDLTRPDIGIPVVRMVVPGLEGWADRGDGIVPGARQRALREQS
jgi:ribosomal protein S12 methylthiotransferase accessory factor